MGNSQEHGLIVDSLRTIVQKMKPEAALFIR